jgi:ubiquitin-protein ligase
MASRRIARFRALINDLRNIGPTSDARIKFIVDTTSLDSEGQSSPTEDQIITGRLLPNSNMYAQGSIRVNIILAPEFPFKPPKVILQTKVYHPNVSEEGK